MLARSSDRKYNDERMKTFLILDGNALLHRAWHAIPPLTAPDGRVVNAAYGFTNVLEKMRADWKPDFMAVAWDLPGETFRHVEYTEYKAQREKKEQELYDQIPIIQSILKVYGIPSLSAEGFEADDVIATLAKTFGKDDVQVKIITGDKDTFQLIDDHVNVVSFIKGLSETKTYDSAAVQERYGLTPTQLIDLKTLAGDPSDNIKGVAGIGEKGAVDLIKQFGSVEAIMTAAKSGEVPSKYAKKLEGQDDLIKQTKRLVTLVHDVDLGDFSLKIAAVHEPQKERLVSAFRDLGFRTLLRRYEAASEVVKESKSVNRGRTPKATKLTELRGDARYLFVDLGQRDLFGGSIRAIALGDGERIAVINQPQTKDLQAVIDSLSAAKLIVGHDLKAAFHVFVPTSYKLPPTSYFDTSVAAYLLSPGTREFDLPTVAFEYLRLSLPESAAEKLALVVKLHAALERGLVKEGMQKLSTEIEMPLIPILFEMERHGIEVDPHKLNDLQVEFAKTLETLTKNIYTLAGHEFNINSPSQLSVVLFDELKLPTKGIKKTKTGLSTGAPELEKIWEAHEIIPLISEFREVAKLQSTYAEALPKMIAADGRIHTTYKQTIAATGRLSSVDPNLQNIPVKTELGNEIRKAFVAPPGRVLLALDYSQFELRLAAVMANDATFIKAFQDGADIHRRTAAEILGVPEDQVTDAQRSAAKAINFGVLYGMGARKLARSTGFSPDEAKLFLDKYFAAHAGIVDFIERMKAKAHEDGYVETIFGRKRYLPDIHSGIGMLVAAAERMAVNMPVQGTQADLLKMAMIQVDRFLREKHSDVKLLLQVHDELVFEVDKKFVAQVGAALQKIMENVYTWGVPLVVNVEYGTNWGEMKKL
jgi:DNA polymerase-1